MLLGMVQHFVACIPVEHEGRSLGLVVVSLTKSGKLAPRITVTLAGHKVPESALEYRLTISKNKQLVFSKNIQLVFSKNMQLVFSKHCTGAIRCASKQHPKG